MPLEVRELGFGSGSDSIGCMCVHARSHAQLPPFLMITFMENLMRWQDMWGQPESLAESQHPNDFEHPRFPPCLAQLPSLNLPQLLWGCSLKSREHGKGLRNPPAHSPLCGIGSHCWRCVHGIDKAVTVYNYSIQAVLDVLISKP